MHLCAPLLDDYPIYMIRPEIFGLWLFHELTRNFFVNFSESYKLEWFECCFKQKLELFFYLGDLYIIGLWVFAGLREKHQQDLEKLTLTSQPFKTLRFFVVAVLLYVRRWSSYLLANVGWLMLFGSIFVAFAALLVTLDGPHVKVNRFWLFLSVALARMFLCFA